MEVESNNKLDWYTSGLQSTEPTNLEETVEEVGEEVPTETIEEVETETVEFVQETAEEVVEAPTVVEPQLVSQKASPRDYIEANKETLKKFLELSDLDVSNISAEDAVRRKIKSDNPYFTEQDVEDEMYDKYSIGKQLEVIDEDNDSLDEIEEKKRRNALLEKEIRIGQRELKKDSVSAYKHLEDLKTSEVELPEWEFQIPVTESPKSQEELIQEFTQAQQQEIEKVKNEWWIPTVNKSISEVGSIKETIETEINGDKVVFEVNYDLSDADKQDLGKYLGDYNVSDEEAGRYSNNGQADIKSFVSDKAKERFRKQVLSLAVKEGVNRALGKFVKEEIANHNPTAPSRAPFEEDKNPATLFDRIKRSTQRI